MKFTVDASGVGPAGNTWMKPGAVPGTAATLSHTALAEAGRPVQLEKVPVRVAVSGPLVAPSERLKLALVVGRRVSKMR
jgi:hypothetical protein